jgi:hypothetical protein
MTEKGDPYRHDRKPPQWNIIIHPELLLELLDIYPLFCLNSARSILTRGIARKLDEDYRMGEFKVPTAKMGFIGGVKGTTQMRRNGRLFPIHFHMEIGTFAGRATVIIRKGNA